VEKRVPSSCRAKAKDAAKVATVEPALYAAPTIPNRLLIATSALPTLQAVLTRSGTTIAATDLKVQAAFMSDCMMLLSSGRRSPRAPASTCAKDVRREHQNLCFTALRPS
jgi:hypothetical protein